MLSKRHYVKRMTHNEFDLKNDILDPIGNFILEVDAEYK
jgi:hypothetical protein